MQEIPRNLKFENIEDAPLLYTHHDSFSAINSFSYKYCQCSRWFSHLTVLKPYILSN